MSAPIQAVLLPGLDGTGELFARVLACCPHDIKPCVVRYPESRILGYKDLVPIAASTLPVDAPFVLVAESFSGPVAIELAARNPRNLLGVVLIASFAVAPRGAWLKRMPWRTLFRVAPPLGVIRRLLVANREEADCLRVAVRRVDACVLANRVREALSVDVGGELTKIACPLVYLQATRDRVVPRSSLKRIAELKTDTQSITVDSLHLVAQDEPMAVVEVIRELTSREPAGLTSD